MRANSLSKQRPNVLKNSFKKTQSKQDELGASRENRQTSFKLPDPYAARRGRRNAIYSINKEELIKACSI